MRFVDRSVGIALGLATLAAIVWASNAATTVHGSDLAVLRLAWSARPERIESCRQQSEEELAKVPGHMRQPVVCDGVTAHYRLTVRVAGKVVAEQDLHGGGLRQDRRLYVFHEVPLNPGEASIDVRFDRLDPDPPPVAAAPGRVAGRQGAGEAVPPHLSFAQRLRIRPREVVLVTYAPERRALVAVQDSSAAVQ